MRILAIETSCDETGVAIVEDGRRIRANVVASQSAHQATGGIVPEVAAREHLRALDPVMQQALRDSGMELGDVDAIAATVGPGLIGALLVGASYGRGLALAAGLPFVGVNHLEGHVYANWLYEREDEGEGADGPTEPRRPPEPELPAIVLVVSGAHSDLVLMEGHRRFRRLGRTIDDAAGEAFDKGARLLGLGYPGGAALDRLARDGDPEAFSFPVARVGELDFSFSGVKTALVYAVRDLGDEQLERRRADLAASYQRAIVRALVGRVRVAASQGHGTLQGQGTVAVVGGVAANSELRAALPEARFAPLSLCSDNAAMIASAGRFSRRLPYPQYLGLDAYASRT